MGSKVLHGINEIQLLVHQKSIEFADILGENAYMIFPAVVRKRRDFPSAQRLLDIRKPFSAVGNSRNAFMATRLRVQRWK